MRGIRIEDDVLVTDGDPEVLSAAIPKEMRDIEAVFGFRLVPNTQDDQFSAVELQVELEGSRQSATSSTGGDLHHQVVARGDERTFGEVESSVPPVG